MNDKPSIHYSERIEAGHLKLALNDHKGTSIISTDDIIYCNSENRYTRFYLRNSQEILICKHLGEYEHLFEEIEYLFRINKSYIINIHHIARIIKGTGGGIQMIDDKLISISKERKEEFFSLLKKIVIDL